MTAAITRITGLIGQLAAAMEEKDYLIETAVARYGEWVNNAEELFPAANISEATTEELRMMLALLQDDHLKVVGEGSMQEFRRWAAGEDVDPWSARFILNWLVLRRESARKRGEDL